MNTDKQLRTLFVQRALDKADKIEDVLPIVAKWMDFINTGTLGKNVLIRTPILPTATKAKAVQAETPTQAKAKKPKIPAKLHKNGSKKYTEEQRQQIAELLSKTRGASLHAKAIKVAPKFGRSVRGIEQQITKGYIPGYGGAAESGVNSAISSSVRGAKAKRAETISAGEEAA